jgi:biotin carboxyl carrier protein
LNFFKVTLSDGQAVNVALTPHDRGWIAQVGETKITLRLLGSDGHNRVSIELDGEVVEMNLDAASSGVAVEEQLAQALQQVIVERMSLAGPAAGETEDVSAQPMIPSPMAGIVLELFVEVGQTVEPGDCVALIEAMKMENRIESITAGVITRIVVEVGSTVRRHDPLFEVSPVAGDGPNQEDRGVSNVTT